MRLTKNVKLAIVAQFKRGASIDYLASIYGVSVKRIEDVVRFYLMLAEMQGQPAEQKRHIHAAQGIEP